MVGFCALEGRVGGLKMGCEAVYGGSGGFGLGVC